MKRIAGQPGRTGGARRPNRPGGACPPAAWMARLVRTVVPSGLPPSVYWLTAGQVVDSLGSGLVFPLTTLFVVQVLGRDLTWAGTVAFFHSLAATLGAALGGRLADSAGRKPVLLWSLLGSAACSFMLGWRQEAATYAAVTVVFGLVISLFRPASQALVSDLVPGRERQVFGLLYMANNLGVAAGAALGGLLASWSFRAVFWADALTYAAFALLLLRAVPDSYGEALRRRRRRGTRPFTGLAPETPAPGTAGTAAGEPAGPCHGAGAASGKLAEAGFASPAEAASDPSGRPADAAGATSVRVPTPGDEPARPAAATAEAHPARNSGGAGVAAGPLPQISPGPRRPVANPVPARPAWHTRLAAWHAQGLVTVVLLAVGSVGLFFPYAQLHTALPVDMTRRGFSEAAYGLLWSLNAVLVVALTPVASAWAERRGWTLDGMLKASAALHAAGFGLLTFTAEWTAYAVFASAMVIITVGEVFHALSYSAAVARVAPADRRGSYQGLAGTIAGVAWMAGPLGGGLIADRLGMVALWSLTVATSLGGLAIFRLAETAEALRRRSPGSTGSGAAGSAEVPATPL
ncbi:hypothetical protein JCM13210_15000 [Thermaerobacter litoralis]